MGRTSRCAAQGLLAIASAIISSAQIAIVEYPIPTRGSGPMRIAAGPDGNMWFTEAWNPNHSGNLGNQIGRITPTGAIEEFLVPTVGSGPDGIAAGPDGNLWFAEYFAQKIGRITTTGEVTEFSLPNGGYPTAITAGPDGNLWFTERFGNKIGRITTTGVVTAEFPIPTPSSEPYGGITTGPDGNLWFTECRGNKIGRITTSGAITEFTIPTPGSCPNEIVAGPDGNLWFTEQLGIKIGRITTSGTITEFAVGGGPVGVTVGADGNIWFVEYADADNKIGQITTAGVVAEFPIPTPNSYSFFIAAGPGGTLWFTETIGNNVGRFSVIPTIDTLFATPKVLWPPNNKLIPVVLSATTSGGIGPVSCKISSITSNEPVSADGDWVITGDLTVDLRAARSGVGLGRVYTVELTCTDTAGNVSAPKTVSVSVWHDQRR